MLTSKQLEALNVSDHGRRLGDSGGLFGVVRAKAGAGISVAFSYRYRFEGKLKDMRCGSWPDKSLKEIRADRDHARSLVSQGSDPALLKKLAKHKKAEEQRNLLAEHDEAVSRLTVGELFVRWKRQELTQRKDNGAEIERSFNKDVLPVIGKMAAEEVKRGHVANILDRVVDRGAPIVASHMLGDIRQMFGFAITRNLVETDPTSHLKKADFGGSAKERERTLIDEEIRQLLQKIPLANLLKSTECAIWIMLSTLCRVGEISRAKWEDLNWSEKTWVIPADNAKNARLHTIFLSPFAIEQFRILHAMTGKSVWMYPNTRDTSFVSVKSISKQVNDRQREVPMSNRSTATQTLSLSGGHWTPHDLRRTGATIMGDSGVNPDVIERCLNHVEPSKVRRTYQRQKLTLEQAEAWMLLGEHLTKLTDGSNV